MEYRKDNTCKETKVVNILVKIFDFKRHLSIDTYHVMAKY